MIINHIIGESLKHLEISLVGHDLQINYTAVKALSVLAKDTVSFLMLYFELSFQELRP